MGYNYVVMIIICNNNNNNKNNKVQLYINPFSATFIKWSNTLKQFVGNLMMNCLSVFDHFVGLTLKGLKRKTKRLNDENYPWILRILQIYFFCSVKFFVRATLQLRD